MLDIKADMLESVMKSPVHPVNMTSDEMVAAVSEAYHKKGFPIDEVGKLGDTDKLLPEVGCRVVTDYNEALVTLGETRGSHLLKSALAMAN